MYIIRSRAAENTTGARFNYFTVYNKEYFNKYVHRILNLGSKTYCCEDSRILTTIGLTR